MNKDIVRSIKDSATHKKFPLFHNGITVVANKVDSDDEQISIETFFVVNGCQSLTALYDNRNHITEDLRILTKFVQVDVESTLSSIITQFSNNQNGVKPRDFKSNNSIQIRLQNEFRDNYGDEFYFEVKRGEDVQGKTPISNEIAGINMMSFDLKEPWGTHRKYQVFDDKYNDLFARPEVTAHRILMLKIMSDLINQKICNVNNKLVSTYALTRASILYILKHILENDNEGKELLKKPENYVKILSSREHFAKCISTIIDDIIVDLNGEIDPLGYEFDYKTKFRDKNWVSELAKNIVTSYLKLSNRGRIQSFESEWSNK